MQGCPCNATCVRGCGTAPKCSRPDVLLSLSFACVCVCVRVSVSCPVQRLLLVDAAVVLDAHLGGEDLDQVMTKHVMESSESKTGKKILGDKRAVLQLRKDVGATKWQLSSETAPKADIEASLDGVRAQETVTRAKFEGLKRELLKQTMDPVKQVTEDSFLTKDKIEAFVMIGA